MNVLDSSAWLEYIAGSKIGLEIKPIALNTECLIVPTIVLYEVTKKLMLSTNQDFAFEVSLEMQRCFVIPATSDISIAAAETSILYKLPMADSIIYTTAKLYNAVLWTCDCHFQNMHDVRYFAKPCPKCASK